MGTANIGDGQIYYATYCQFRVPSAHFVYKIYVIETRSERFGFFARVQHKLLNELGISLDFLI